MSEQVLLGVRVDYRISATSPQFLRYAQVELGFRPQTIERYQYCLRRTVRSLGDIPLTELSEHSILELKSALLASDASVCWQVVMLAALKRLLQYCRDVRGWPVLDPNYVRIPRRPRREVLYLTADEVNRFISVIPSMTLRGGVHSNGLRFRALVEVLLGSAMRIGEALSLDRSHIDFERKEARVIGKGNKERTVFFTDRAVSWLQNYLSIRTDEHPALFVSQNGRTRLTRTDIWRPFSRYRKLAGINKPVRPHLLRHTAATQLLFNGCPVGHIKEILGHERLETTCRYYLGLDKRAAKQAHATYLSYDGSIDTPTA